MSELAVDWKKKSIGELTTVIRGASPRPKGDPRYYGGNVPRLMVSDVTRDGKWVTPRTDFLTEAGALLSRPMKKGGLVVVCSGTVGVPCFLNVDACIHDGFLGLTNIVSDVDPDYLYQQFLFLKNDLDSSATHGGIFTNLTTDIIKQFVISVPSYIQQQKIANILNTVDKLIEKTQTLIDKYTAIKQGMMADLFTRGIDLSLGPDGTPASNPNYGQLRDSVEDAPELYQQTELGWVPKDWEVCVLGENITKIDSGWSPVCDSEVAQSHEWGVLKTTAVVWDGYKDYKNKKLPLNLKGAKSVEVKVGDLLVTRKGPMDRVGVVVHVNKTRPQLMFPDTVFRFRVNSDYVMSPRFAALCLGAYSVQNQWDIRKIGLAEAQVNINHGIVNNTLVPIPKNEEQESIICTLATITEKIEIELALFSKYKLQKSGLMQDLLTGKVRVN